MADEQTCFDGKPCDREDGDCNKCKWMGDVLKGGD